MVPKAMLKVSHTRGNAWLVIKLSSSSSTASSRAMPGRAPRSLRARSGRFHRRAEENETKKHAAGGTSDCALAAAAAAAAA
eukprot:CAMPEP_0115423284 /NCGR_PEP_ID=MMETSP0271-20121206/27225_1 /TAXON_ID=71861 /ORGANISM="Scrippsiella trochoidea, Strain CCMP3099" /LENGTH=80 /DNA_ID=CAMNT_0002848027 /DNA_START=1044 /DNA_END=1284 /DNA_ORIENTATION=-